MGDSDWAIRCAGKVLSENSAHFEARRMTARCLLEQEQYAEAEHELAWCLKRRPDDRRLAEMYRQAVRKRIDGETRATADVRRTGILR